MNRSYLNKVINTNTQTRKQSKVNKRQSVSQISWNLRFAV